MIRTAILYGLVDMCIDLMTKQIISIVDLMPTRLIGQRFDSVMATLPEDELPPFVRPTDMPIPDYWGHGNVRLDNTRIDSYSDGEYTFIIFGSLTYALRFNDPVLYRAYRKLYIDLGIFQTSNDDNCLILIRFECRGDWINIKKSDIVIPSALLD